MVKEDSDSPYRKAHPQGSRKAHASAKPHAPHKHASGRSAAKKPKGGSASGRRRRGKSGARKAGRAHVHHVHSAHTSHPTTRGAQVSTRAWLLKEYGPVCAYCGGRFTARKMTLDHVAPRRGQTAYDRRDNLVLACTPCNALKRDQSPLAFLLGLRSRAVNLVRFGAHLSQGLIEMARSLVPSDPKKSAERDKIDYSKWGPPESDDDSPYRS